MAAVSAAASPSQTWTLDHLEEWYARELVYAWIRGASVDPGAVARQRRGQVPGPVRAPLRPARRLAAVKARPLQHEELAERVQGVVGEGGGAGGEHGAEAHEQVPVEHRRRGQQH